MGWIKAIEEESTGVSVSFWEVMSVQYDHRAQESVLQVGGWISKAAYEAGKAPVLTKSWVIPAGLAPQLAAGAVAFVTGYARGREEFAGSEEG